MTVLPRVAPIVGVRECGDEKQSRTKKKSPPMSSPQKKSHKASNKLLEEYIGADNLKDIKFAGAAFVAIVILIFHYAWIMRQMVMNPQMSTLTLYTYFGMYGVTLVVMVTVLLKYVYPRIYTEVSEEKKTQ